MDTESWRVSMDTPVCSVDAFIALGTPMLKCKPILDARSGCCSHDEDHTLLIQQLAALTLTAVLAASVTRVCVRKLPKSASENTTLAVPVGMLVRTIWRRSSTCA